MYDILGREVTTLVNEEKAAGTYSVNFDGSNLSSGIYFYTKCWQIFSDKENVDDEVIDHLIRNPDLGILAK